MVTPMTQAVMWQVIYEDDDLLAVSKPPFLPTAPRHRWEVCRWCVLSQVLLSAYSSSTPWVQAFEGLMLRMVWMQGGSLVNRVLNYLGEALWPHAAAMSE